MSEAEQPKYDASSIKVLEGLEAVRKRPAMYIGDTGIKGLHHLVWEVVDNSVDESLAGRCNKIDVTIHNDGSLSVRDDGRGIPVDMHESGVPALEVILTKLHAGGKFDKGSYQVSGGLHGVGISVVNALSASLEVQVFKEGKIYQQTFAHGDRASELTVIGECPAEETGTLVRFKPDFEVMEVNEFSYETLRKRLRELAYLMGTVGLTLSVTDEREELHEEFHYPGALRDFVQDINQSKQPVHEEVIYLNKTVASPTNPDVVYVVELALQYNDGYNETISTFVNNIHTSEGGTHLAGFRAALTRSLNNYARTHNLIKAKENPPSGDDLREGLTTVLSVKVPDPQFESQTKIKLGNREVQGIVESVVGEGLKEFFEEHPNTPKAIFNKAMDALRAREAARKARELVRRKSALEGNALPAKLADCHKGTNPEDAELFLVEGDSAGGTAKQGRASFQAILPLRGKILNVEKAPVDSILNHEEIKTIVTAVGTGFLGDEFDPAKMRYGKIIIMTDADVDGSHIRTLLLTLFYRKLPALVEAGYLYVAQPPLFLVKKGKQERYAIDEIEKDRIKMEMGLGETRLRLTLMDGSSKEYAGDELTDLLSMVARIGSFKQRITRDVDFDFGAYLAEATIPELDLPNYLLIHGEEPRFLDTENQMLAELEKLRAGGVTRIYDGTDAGSSRGNAEVQVYHLHHNSELTRLLRRMVEHNLAPELFFAGSSKQVEVVIGADTETHADLFAAWKGLEEAMKGKVKEQRYKGLGEMNGAQLYESTMDPERRTLYQVTINDAVEADKMFDVLMGPNVEPRRDFIEKHALEATNLDV